MAAEVKRKQPGMPKNTYVWWKSFREAVTFTCLLSSKTKTNTMQKKNWILWMAITFILLAGVIALRASTSAPQPVEDNTCCQKGAPACKEAPASSGDVLPETLSRQFIILLAPVY